MPNTHGYVNTTKCTAENVDAYNCAGVYAAGDLDNGVMVTLQSINKNTVGGIQGYEYNVVPATATSTNVWVVKTPEVGATLETQLMADPRYFYNEAGRAMSLAYMNPSVDCIEVNKEAFVAGSDPESVANATFVTIGAGGKLVAQTTAPTGEGAYFSIEGKHSVDAGIVLFPTVVLRCVRN